MRQKWTRLMMVGSLCCLVALGLSAPRVCLGEDAEKPLSRDERAKVDHVLVLDAQTEIEKMLSHPVEMLEEKLLTAIETRQDIAIKRSSMVKTELCLHELLFDVANLAKVSTGHAVDRVEVQLKSITTRASIWSDWRSRKLEAPELTITLYYNDKTIEPSRLSCSGHKYH